MTGIVSTPTESAPRVATTWLDELTGRVTMYRLVLLALLAVLAESLVASLLGVIAYSPVAILANGAVVVAATVVSSRVFAVIFRVKPHTESSIVTALILLFVFNPALSWGSVGAVALAGVVASASKYLLAFRGRHIFNPAALAAFVLSIAIPSQFPGWWVGSPWLLPLVAIGAFVVLQRTRHVSLGIVFAVVAVCVVTATSLSFGLGFEQALRNAVLSSPVVFFAGFMLSEPLTLPPRRWQQLALAVVVGVLFGVPFSVGPVIGSYELALVVGNLLAFLVGQRRGIRLLFVGKEQLTPTTWELTFEPRHPVAFAAGQYMELSLPHGGADVRGQRRTFSIVSRGDGGDRGVGAGAGGAGSGVVRFGMTVAQPSSSFKTALLALAPGDPVSATAVGGDFVLPRDPSRPLLFVAGGIGITPFVSHLTALRQAGDERDIALVYSVASVEQAAYRDVLTDLGAHVVLIAPADPDTSPTLPDGWRYAGSGPLTPTMLAETVPDAARRHAYVSGSPRLVHSVRRTLRHAGVHRVTTDAFSGY